MEIYVTTNHLCEIKKEGGLLGLSIYMWLTLLFWDWIPVRIAFFSFCLILLDFLIKARKWDKENAEKERQKQERIDRLRKLKRGQHLYIYNEPWYQEMQEDKGEKETSPPVSSQDSVQDSSESSENTNPKSRKKRKRIFNKFILFYECRCLYNESVKLADEAREEVSADMKSKNKKPKQPKYHRRD